jgi:CheY-like chemotaxis protein
MATVLIADDDANTRLLVRTVLAHAGHDVAEAPSGREALENAAAAAPDLILLDLSMPDMHGADLLRALRSDPHMSSINIALYTATPMNAALRDFMEIYAIRYAIPKPSEPNELLRAVEEALTQR